MVPSLVGWGRKPRLPLRKRAGDLHSDDHRDHELDRFGRTVAERDESRSRAETRAAIGVNSVIIAASLSMVLVSAIYYIRIY
jgi:hypothetical protein